MAEDGSYGRAAPYNNAMSTGPLRQSSKSITALAPSMDLDLEQQPHPSMDAISPGPVTAVFDSPEEMDDFKRWRASQGNGAQAHKPSTDARNSLNPNEQFTTPSQVRPEQGILGNAPQAPMAPTGHLPTASSNPQIKTEPDPTNPQFQNRPSSATSIATSQSNGKQAYLIEVPYYEDDSGHSGQSKPIARHNPHSEAPPNTEVHHPSFHEAERCLGGLYRRFIDILEEEGHDDDSDVQFLRRHAHELASFTYPDAVIIGLRGDTGRGKSSLINSLLALDGDVAPQSEGIRACTAFVQEFSASTSGCGAIYQAEIDFLPEATRKQMLINYLADFFDFKGNKDVDDEVAWGELSKGSKACIDALKSMFADCEHFKSTASTEAFLMTFKGHNDPKLHGPLCGRLKEYMSGLGIDMKTNKIIVSADGAGKLAKALDPFMKSGARLSEDGELQPSLWPIVRHVRTFLNSPLLDQSIVLVDLPGTGDTNQTRVSTSNDYMRKMDYTIVVADMCRNESNDTIYKELKNAFKRGKSGSSIVVITKSDEISDSVDPNHPLRPAGTEGNRLVPVALALEKTRAELGDLRERVDVARLREEYSKRIRELSAMEKELACQYYGMLRGFRDNQTAESWRTEYRNAVRDDAFLPVFCVSNTVYRDSVLGKQSNILGGMTVDQTNIPALRRHLYRLPASRKFKTLEHQCKYRLQKFLAIVEMSCSQSKLQRMENLDRIIKSPRKIIQALISGIYDELKNQVVKSLLKKLKNSRKKWLSAADKHIEKWATWNDGTYKAVCRRLGVFKSKAYGDIDWNTDLLKPVVRDLKDDLGKCDEASIALSGKLCEEFEILVNKLKTDLEGAAGPSVLDTFFSTLGHTKAELFKLAEKAGEKLEQDLEDIREKITNTYIPRVNYFIKSLTPTYEECADISGKGAHKRRIAKFNDTIKNSRKGPYTAITTGAQKDVKKLFSKHSEDLAQDVLALFEHVHEVFSTNFSTTEDDTPQAKAIREKLRGELLPAKQLAEGPLRKFLDDCRNNPLQYQH
ncbi:hypothetical protein IWZ01DRAFT_567910 [Phyllosticta capitalensis]